MSNDRNLKRSRSQIDDKYDSQKRRSISEETGNGEVCVRSYSVPDDGNATYIQNHGTETGRKEITEKLKNINLTVAASVENKTALHECVVTVEKTYSNQKGVSHSDNTSTGRLYKNSSEMQITSQSHKGVVSVSDSVFSEASVRSASEYCGDDSDDPLEEYETQNFGFTPKSFMNGVYNALAEYIRESLQALTEYIRQQYPEEMTASQLQKGEEEVVKYVLRKLNRSFDILEQYLMTNVFKIPDHVVLPEDQVQEGNKYTEEDEKRIDLEIQQLKNQILSIRYANGVLRQDFLEMDEVQKIFDASINQLETLEDLSKDCGISNVRDNTIYAVNQVKKIISIVQSLDQTEK